MYFDKKKQQRVRGYNKVVVVVVVVASTHLILFLPLV